MVSWWPSGLDAACRDLTLPIISVFNGHGFDRVIRDSFSDGPQQIEDLWLRCDRLPSTPGYLNKRVNFCHCRLIKLTSLDLFKLIAAWMELFSALCRVWLEISCHLPIGKMSRS